jgi:hypothetical protein
VNLLPVGLSGLNNVVKTSLPWSALYQEQLQKKVAEKFRELTQHPSFEYPNTGYANIKFSDEGKVLLFGYGSLMNTRLTDIKGKFSIKLEHHQAMSSAVIFGGRRIYNYVESKGYRKDERLPHQNYCLNLVETRESSDIVNGVLIAIDEEDLGNLVDRELGYDLVPVLAASWDDVVKENSDITIKVAYTFMASKNPRDGITYATCTDDHPIPGYLKAVSTAAKSRGSEFFATYLQTTYLADETTSLERFLSVNPSYDS